MTETPKQTVNESRRARYILLELAADLLPGERVATCSKFPVPNTQKVDVNYTPATHSAHFSGLAVCGSAWHCPVCASRIATERREELHEALDQANARGWGFALVTFTLQHNPGDRLKELVNNLTEAYRRTKRGAPWERFVKRFEIVGHVTALEVTHGANGWHPHKHAVFFTARPLSDDELAAMRDWLSDRFARTLERLGGYASPIYGVDVRSTPAAIDYIVKWGADHELTNGSGKNGHGLTPFQLLAAYGQGDKRAGALFQEYAAAMKGANQLRWSVGLRDVLGIGQERSDAELAEIEDAEELAETPAEEKPESVLLLSLSREQWSAVVRQRARADLLSVAGFGDAALCWRYLETIGVREHEKRKTTGDGLSTLRRVQQDHLEAKEAQARAIDNGAWWLRNKRVRF